MAAKCEFLWRQVPHCLDSHRMGEFSAPSTAGFLHRPPALAWATGVLCLYLTMPSDRGLACSSGFPSQCVLPLPFLPPLGAQFSPASQWQLQREGRKGIWAVQEMAVLPAKACHELFKPDLLVDLWAPFKQERRLLQQVSR